MTRTSLETPDELLVIEAIFGDFDAFDELALRYRAAVVRTAQAVVGRDDAEDVAQDALLLAFKALPSIEDPTKFAAWLSAITRHRALRFNKQESAHKGAAAFCAENYNRVLARLKELDEGVGAVFEPLPVESSLTVTAIACRQLAAYYEDELGAESGFRGAYGFAFNPRWWNAGEKSKRDCRNFWSEAGHDIEDLGEFIRESINEWTRR